MKIFRQKEVKRREEYWNATYKARVIDTIGVRHPRIAKVLKTIVYLDSTLPIGSGYLFGPVGTGKSVSAAIMVLQWHLLQHLQGTGLKSYAYITLADLLYEVKCSYDKDGVKVDVLEKYRKVHFLVLDDVGAFRYSDWAYEFLYMLLTYRYDQMKITVYTANITLEEFAVLLHDDRLTSRIQHECKGNIQFFDKESMRT